MSAAITPNTPCKHHTIGFRARTDDETVFAAMTVCRDCNVVLDYTAIAPAALGFSQDNTYMLCCAFCETLTKLPSGTNSLPPVVRGQGWTCDIYLKD